MAATAVVVDLTAQHNNKIVIVVVPEVHATMIL